MTEPTSAPTVTPLGLVSRIIGVITSPKATFENVVAAPRPFGILFVVAAVIALGQGLPQMTDAGRKASLDMQVKMTERMTGNTITPEAYEVLEQRSKSPLRFIGLAAPFIVLPLIALFWAALYWVTFNTLMGGTATFKQPLAIVAHSTVIAALGVVASLPIILMQGTIKIGGPFSLGALAPGLESGSKLATFLSLISVFTLWAFVTDAIGLGVLYKRNSRNIAIGLVAVFLLLMYLSTLLFSSFMGGTT